MKKAILLAAALTLAASAANAHSLFYAWNTCFHDGGASSVTFVCDDFNPSTSFATYQLDAAVSGVVAVSGVIDLSVNGAATLPSFWHMEGGGCNDGGVAIDDNRTPCTNTGGLPTFPGSTGQNTDAFVTAYGAGFGGPNKARVLTSVNRASSNPANLTAAKHFAFKLNWNDDNAEEAGGSCQGCTAVVSQALNSILLESPFTSASGDAVAAVITSADPGSQPSTCINASNCDVVPVKNRSWGQLKSLYR
jgi:hypothetical protein